MCCSRLGRLAESTPAPGVSPCRSGPTLSGFKADGVPTGFVASRGLRPVLGHLGPPWLSDPMYATGAMDLWLVETPVTARGPGRMGRPRRSSRHTAALEVPTHAVSGGDAGPLLMPRFRRDGEGQASPHRRDQGRAEDSPNDQGRGCETVTAGGSAGRLRASRIRGRRETRPWGERCGRSCCLG